MDNLIKLFILPTIIGLAGGIIISESPTIKSDVASSLSVIKNYREQTLSDKPAIAMMKPTTTPIPSPTITIIPTVVPKKQPQQAPSTSTDKDWGVAKQVGEHTYTINVGNDDHMTSPQEVFQAFFRQV
jgi:hypothetical protein